MALVTQAATEYAALAIQRAALFVGRQFSRLRELGSEHTIVLLMVVVAVLAVYALRPGPGGRR